MAIEPTTEGAAAFRRAMRAYELGRARHAAIFAFPLIVIAIVAVCFGTRPTVACALGCALVVTACFLLWRGQTLGRAVLPGILAGLVPLALAIGARAYGHVCTGGQCVSLCIPACTLGGVVAGFVIARAAKHAASRGLFVGGASALAVLVGSLGCSCVGFGGIAGLGLGVLASIAPTLVASSRRPL